MTVGKMFCRYRNLPPLRTPTSPQWLHACLAPQLWLGPAIFRLLLSHQLGNLLAQHHLRLLVLFCVCCPILDRSSWFRGSGDPRHGTKTWQRITSSTVPVTILTASLLLAACYLHLLMTAPTAATPMSRPTARCVTQHEAGRLCAGTCGIGDIGQPFQKVASAPSTIIFAGPPCHLADSTLQGRFENAALATLNFW